MSHPIILFSCNTLGRRIKTQFHFILVTIELIIFYDSDWSRDLIGYEFSGIVEKVISILTKVLFLLIYLMTIYGFSSRKLFIILN